MNGQERIRQALIDNDIYPIGEINACTIYKNWEGWHIQKFGEVGWKAGATIEEALKAIKDIAESRES